MVCASVCVCVCVKDRGGREIERDKKKVFVRDREIYGEGESG